MLKYARASKLTTLASMAALMALALLIISCGDDDADEPAPPPATVDVAAISAGVSASITAQMEQTIRNEMANMQPPLSEDEIRSLIESAISQSAPEGVSAADIQALSLIHISEPTRPY